MNPAQSGHRIKYIGASPLEKSLSIYPRPDPTLKHRATYIASVPDARLRCQCRHRSRRFAIGVFYLSILTRRLQIGASAGIDDAALRATFSF
jgi:hypothetical protein